MKNIRTWHLWLMVICSSCYGLFIASTFKSYGSLFITSDTFLSIVGSIGAVCNGLGRPLWATLLDYLGFKKVYFIMTIS